MIKRDYIYLAVIILLVVAFGSYYLGKPSIISGSVTASDSLNQVRNETIQSSCANECSSDYCEGQFYYGCLNVSGCMKKQEKNVTIGKCEVQCENDSECNAWASCKNYKCVNFFDAETLQSLVVSNNTIKISSQDGVNWNTPGVYWSSISALIKYSNGNFRLQDQNGKSINTNSSDLTLNVCNNATYRNMTFYTQGYRFSLTNSFNQEYNSSAMLAANTSRWCNSYFFKASQDNPFSPPILLVLKDDKGNVLKQTTINSIDYSSIIRKFNATNDYLNDNNININLPVPQDVRIL